MSDAGGESVSDDPRVYHNMRRAIHVGLPTPLVLDPGTSPSQETLHEWSAGRRGENKSEKDRLTDLLKRKEFFNDELRSTKDLIRIQKEKTAGFKLAAHLLDGVEAGFEKDALLGLGRMAAGVGKLFGRGAAPSVAKAVPGLAGFGRPARAAQRVATRKTGMPLKPSQSVTREGTITPRQPIVQPARTPTQPKVPPSPQPPPPPEVPPVGPPPTSGGSKLSKTPQGVARRETQRAFKRQEAVGKMTDPQAMEAAARRGLAPAPSGVKKFLAGGTGQFAAQMGMMMFPYHKVFGEESALSQVAPLAAFMGAPGMIAKYTGAAGARAALGRHAAGLPKVGSISTCRVTKIV